MNNKVFQHNPRMQTSKSNLRLGDSALQSYSDEKHEHFKSPKARTNATSNIKIRKLADLLNFAKESSYERHVAKKSPDDGKNVQISPKKTRPFMFESFNVPINRHISPSSRFPFKLDRERVTTTKNNRANRTKNTISPSDSDKKELNASAVNRSVRSVLNHTLKESNSSQLNVPNTSNKSTRIRHNIQKPHHTDRIFDKRFPLQDQAKPFEDFKYEKKIEKFLEPLEESFELTPFRKQDTLNTGSSGKHNMNIVPSNSPCKLVRRMNHSSQEKLSIERQMSKQKIGSEKKIPLSQFEISLGREVILINNQTMCSTAVTDPSNRTPNRIRGNVPVLKLQKTRTSSGNLSFEEVSRAKSKETQIEDKIEALLSNKSVDELYFQEINNYFEAFIEKTTATADKSEFLKHKEVLKKIKLAYEIFFRSYFANMQRQKEKLSIEKAELLLQNKMLKTQLDEYGEGVKIVRETNSHKSTANTQNEQIMMSNHRPTPSQILSANKKNLGEMTESPPATNKIETQDHEKEALRSVIKNQQSQINTLMKKEIDIIRLADVCNKKGIDILGIYRKEFKREIGDTEHIQAEECDTPLINKNELPIKNCTVTKQALEKFKGRYVTNPISSEQSSYRSENHSGTERNSKSNSSEDLICHNESGLKHQKQLNLNPSLKNKLKLDFTTLKCKNTHPAEVPGLNLNVIKSEGEPVGFHEEFMSRLEEFSFSWRQAAQNERKIP